MDTVSSIVSNKNRANERGTVCLRPLQLVCSVGNMTDETVLLPVTASKGIF
jgi:hypothetical protein